MEAELHIALLGCVSLGLRPAQPQLVRRELDVDEDKAEDGGQRGEDTRGRQEPPTSAGPQRPGAVGRLGQPGQPLGWWPPRDRADGRGIEGSRGVRRGVTRS